MTKTQEAVRQFVNFLLEGQEKEVFVNRLFGFSVRHVAKDLGVSPQKVYRLERSAVDKLNVVHDLLAQIRDHVDEFSKFLPLDDPIPVENDECFSEAISG